MEEVGLSVAKKLAEYLVDPTLRQLQYLFCVGEITRNVEIRKEELILKQGRVQERVQEAINRTERIDDEVDKWKKNVESLIAEVENLEEELKASNGCLPGWCPTWRRFCFCKKLAKTTKRMIDLNTKSDCFNPFSHPVIIPDIEYHTSQNFKLFNSTQMAFGQLWKALKDDGCFIIGLWGMGGSGKTTLVKEVGKKAKESQLFDRVVLASISQSPDIRKIQGEIADTLGIELKEESEIGRAKRIALRLENKEQILIILDDAWAMLNLEAIGIPFGGNHQRSCKVVLTTRRKDVCTLMGCEKEIQLDLLKEDEAWTLFQTHANVGDVVKEDVARAIAMECKGLPIAIVAVGTCLKGKGIDEMKEMLYRLMNAKPITVDKGVRDAFACLELSFDYLATPEAKLLLLMCAMFPEDFEIDVEDLFRYGMGLGLCRDVYSFETARSKVATAINHLIDSSLLMDNSFKSNVHTQKYVKLHDMVRDLALWIASKENRTIMVNCIEMIADDTVKDCYAFSSWSNNNKLLQFPSQFHAPKLEFLLLHSSSELLDISHATFEGTKGLKVLIIMNPSWRFKKELQPHAQSIEHLSNLRTLRLQDWNLCDISFVVSLTRLEILDLQGSEFARVPDGIEKLSKLKLLDLSRCSIEECFFKVIARCSQLEELYVSTHYSHPRNTNCYEYLGDSTANLLKIRRYNLNIGKVDEIHFSFPNEGTRSLRLGQLNIALLGAVLKDLAQRATIIEFYELEGGSKSFMADIVQAVGGMNELTKLCLQRCLEIEYIIDETTPQEDAVVPRLEELLLEDMHILKQLWRGHSPFSLFQKLRRLNIFNCPQLLNIFTTANCNLGNLKSLTISNCRLLTSLFPVSATCTLLSLMELRIEDALQMKFVFGENASEEQLMHDQDESQIELRLLEYLKLYNLPNLVGICSGRYCPRWPSIKELDWRNCPNMKLQQLEGNQLRSEEYKPLAAIERIELVDCGVEFFFHHQIGLKEQIPTFQCLKELTLQNCSRLKFVFSAHRCQNLPELTSVKIFCCEELEAIFLGNEETQKNVPIAESFLLKLKLLQISRCKKLKFVLSFMISVGTSMLSQLSILSISDCSQMEEVFKCSNIEHDDIESDRKITLPNMKSIELNNLPRFVNVCQGLKFHTGELDRVEIHNCPKLMPVKSATFYWTKGELQELNVHQLMNEEDQSLTAIKRIILDNCEVESIFHLMTWLEVQILTFQCLKELTLENCARLKFVFSAHICQNLPELTYVTISCCKELEAIYLGNEETQKNLPIAESFLLKLRMLEISKCNKLKFVFSFMISATTSMVPQLSTLNILDCSQIEEVFKISNIEHHDIDSYREIMLPNMKSVELDHLPRFVNICQGFKFSTGELGRVKIHDCPKLMSIKGATIDWTEERLVREYVLKYNQINDKEALNLPLSVLIPGELDIQSPRAEHKCLIIGDDDQEETNNSGMLRLEQQMLGGLVPTQVMSFQYLHSLQVTHCKKLKFLFSMSTIVQNSLPKLTSLTLSDCEELEVIFGHSGEDDVNYGHTIVLSSLKMIELRNLPNFKSVCRVRSQIQVELRHISICNCPKFVDSSLRSALQQLGTLSVSTEDSNVVSSPNVNEEKGMMLISRVEHLRLEDSLNLISVWEGPTFIMFQNLVELYVIKCRRLKCIFPSAMMRSLPCLEYLWIEESEEFEEVMSSEEEQNHFPNNSLCFPQLQTLIVSRCRKLKWLFPSLPSTQSLPMLWQLEIKECSQVKGLCNREVEIHEEGFYNNSLPMLTSLLVEDCPMFSETTLVALQSWQRQNSKNARDDEREYLEDHKHD